MSRRLRIILIGLGVIAFLVVSGMLARFLDVENVERDAVLGVLQAEARGDAPAVLAALHGCAAACQATARADAASLRGPGAVTILADQSPTAYSLTGTTGPTRVAWKIPARLPTVQCVLVRRTGNVITGVSLKLLAISAPIPLQSDC
jgi:hypothetical protein